MCFILNNFSHSVEKHSASPPPSPWKIYTPAKNNFNTFLFPRMPSMFYLLLNIFMYNSSPSLSLLIFLLVYLVPCSSLICWSMVQLLINRSQCGQGRFSISPCILFLYSSTCNINSLHTHTSPSIIFLSLKSYDQSHKDR